MTNKLTRFLHTHRRPGSIFRKHGSSSSSKNKSTIQKNDSSKTWRQDPFFQDDLEDTVRLEESGSEYSSILSLSVEATATASPSPTTVIFEAASTEEEAIEVSATTEAAATAVSTTKTNTKKQVTFDSVTVRHYELILGDNPYCKFPLGLGWRYTSSSAPEHATVPVQEFEDSKDLRKAQTAADRISPRLYVPPVGLGDAAAATEDPHYLPVHTETDFDDAMSKKLLAELDLQQRRIRLRSYGFTESQLRQAERERRIGLALEHVQQQAPVEVEEEEEVSATPKGSPTKAIAPNTPPSLPFAYSPRFITRYTR